MSLIALTAAATMANGGSFADSVTIALLVGFWLAVLRWIAPNIWADILGALQPVIFSFTWLSFLRRRGRTERFLALADRLRRDNVRKPVDRNLISGGR
jgi:hypothetical protein